MKNYFKIILVEIRHQNLVLIVDERGGEGGRENYCLF